jgi:hypothetical protein
VLVGVIEEVADAGTYVALSEKLCVPENEEVSLDDIVGVCVACALVVDVTIGVPEPVNEPLNVTDTL